MNENPYSQLLKVFDKEIDSNVRLGIIKSLNPFIIEIGELVLDKDNLLVNKDIITDLNIRDRVLILKDGQTYIVVCRVVNV